MIMGVPVFARSRSDDVDSLLASYVFGVDFSVAHQDRVYRAHRQDR